MQSLRDIVSSADEPVAVRDLRLIVSNAESRYHLFQISASMEPHGNTPPGHICAFVYHIYIYIENMILYVKHGRTYHIVLCYRIILHHKYDIIR